jgi:hypothetical protein
MGRVGGGLEITFTAYQFWLIYKPVVTQATARIRKAMKTIQNAGKLGRAKTAINPNTPRTTAIHQIIAFGALKFIFRFPVKIIMICLLCQP